MGLPGGSIGKDSACNAGAPRSIPGAGRSPGEGSAIYPVFLTGECHGQRSPQMTVHGASKSQTQMSAHTSNLFVSLHLNFIACRHDGVGACFYPA